MLYIGHQNYPCENRNPRAQLRKGSETLTEESLLLKKQGNFKAVSARLSSDVCAHGRLPISTDLHNIKEILHSPQTKEQEDSKPKDYFCSSVS